jgi:hypothetical protein
MKVLLCSTLLSAAAPLLAQAPAALPATQSQPQAHTSQIGFSYSIPSDWEVVDVASTLPLVQQQAAKTATSEDEKKGIDCVQIALTARHGTPPSVVVVVALPYACFGQTMTDKDLPGFASGTSGGLQKSFDLTDPNYGAYSLGTHSVWIERAKGSLISHPDSKFTVETVCSILKKAAVCWMAMAANTDALDTFEHGAVTLDGETAPLLVPADAFVKKPL